MDTVVSFAKNEKGVVNAGFFDAEGNYCFARPQTAFFQGDQDVLRIGIATTTDKRKPKDAVHLTRQQVRDLMPFFEAFANAEDFEV